MIVQIIRSPIYGNHNFEMGRKADRCRRRGPERVPELLNTFRPMGLVDLREGFEGAALEGLVTQHLRAWIAYGNRYAKIYFWRTRSGEEVDFIV